MKYYFLFVIIFFMVDAQAQLTVGVVDYDVENTFDGYNLFYPIGQNSVFLIDNCGRKINEWGDTGLIPGSSVELLEDGTLLKTSGKLFDTNTLPFLPGAGNKLELKDWDNNTLWEYTIADMEKRMHHDFKSLPNGNVLILAWEVKSGEAARLAGRDTTVTAYDGLLYPDYLVEVQPEGADGGTIVWRWNAWDHMVQDFDESKDNFGVVAEHPELININYPAGDDSRDWLHTNAIDYNAELDHILISSPGFNEVWIIDHSTTTEEAAGHTGGKSGKGGDLIYRWGNPAAYSKSDDPPKLNFQHDPHWIEQGLDSSDTDYGKILVFNNQAGEDFSTVNIFAPLWDSRTNSYAINEDGTFAPGDFEFTYTADNPTDLYSNNVSGAQKLPNGNLLICSGVQRLAFEITIDKEQVWKYVNPVRSAGGGFEEQGATNPNGALLFRFNRYAKDFKGFDGKDLTPGDYLELNPDSSLCVITGVDDFSIENSIKIFPNPASDFIFVEGKNINVNITLYNVIGAKVVQQSINAQNNSIETKHLPVGSYLLSVDNKYYKKINIQ